MKTHLSILFCILFYSTLFAQGDNKPLNERIGQLETENAKLRDQIKLNQNSIEFLTDEFNRYMYSNDELIVNNEKVCNDQTIIPVIERMTAFEREAAELKAKHENYMLFMAIGLVVLAVLMAVFVIMINRARKKLKYALFYRIVAECDQIKNDVFNMVSQSTEDMKYVFSADLHNVDDTLQNEITTIKDSMIVEIETISKDMRDDLMHITGSIKKRIESEFAAHDNKINKQISEANHSVETSMKELSASLLARIEKLEKEVVSLK